jgi:hypothetical protein
MSMDKIYIELEDECIKRVKKELRNNFAIMFLSFSLLITSIVFIESHPRTACYWFMCGFFLCHMICLVGREQRLKNIIRFCIYKKMKVMQEKGENDKLNKTDFN